MFSAKLGALDRWFNGLENQGCCGNPEDLGLKGLKGDLKGDNLAFENGLNQQESLNNQHMALRPAASFKLESILQGKMTWRKVAKEFAAEALGTCVLIMFGCGCVAQSVLSHGKAGETLSINLGWGLGVLIGIMVAGPVSGAHLNPAVSTALAAVGKFPWKKLGHYISGQYLGAFLGAALVFFNYKDALDNFTGPGDYQVDGPNATAGIFVTFPREGISNFNGAVDQVIGTALLMMAISAINLPANSKVSSSTGPLLVALSVVAIGICFGFNAGYAINPCRDLGPRLFLLVAGWGGQAFSSHNHWWWIPVVCCHLGGFFGAVLHWAVVECCWESKDQCVMEKEKEENKA